MRKMKTPRSFAISKKASTLFISAALLFGNNTNAQRNDSIIIQQITREVNDSSQLKALAHELLDNIGPRLTGTPQMKQANDWAVAKYKTWGINARNEQWGEWRGWERGVSHIDLEYPRVKSLEGMQLAWSPGTNGKTLTAETIILPDMQDSVVFKQWLPAVKGKFVLISMNQPTGRPDENLEEFGLKETVDKIKKERTDETAAWAARIRKAGLSGRGALARALENAGAAGLVQCNWSRGWGVNKIFGATTKKIPTVDISVEDYGLLYRLTESGDKPKISVRADSKELGLMPTFNTIAEIRGSEKPNEYVILSAHFDSWDGG
jgi:carboxypeptidase Q